MKRIIILGSTGSIGTGALDVVRSQSDKFTVLGLGAGGNRKLLFKQIEEFQPAAAVLARKDSGRRLKKELDGSTDIWWGPEGLERLATLDEADLILAAIPGVAGLLPTIAAIQAGKTIALASKEILVAAGEVVMPLARERGVSILPVDSEHSAIFQCLRGRKREEVNKIILTASGGPFLDLPSAKLAAVTPAEALNHPRWDMGSKVSLDSATMMNKGLEVIEASHLFDIPFDRIEVVIHPESIIHSMVEMRDGSIIAQLSEPDMRLPISYAFNYPDRSDHIFSPTSLPDLTSLTFRRPDRSSFPALDLAYRAGKEGGTMPAVLNAANEVAGDAFLKGEIDFPEIMVLVGEAMAAHRSIPAPDLETIIAADRWAREQTRIRIEGKEGLSSK